jgi:hypothetical protein
VPAAPVAAALSTSQQCRCLVSHFLACTQQLSGQHRPSFIYVWLRSTLLSAALCMFPEPTLVHCVQSTSYACCYTSTLCITSVLIEPPFHCPASHLLLLQALLSTRAAWRSQMLHPTQQQCQAWATAPLPLHGLMRWAQWLAPGGQCSQQAHLHVHGRRTCKAFAPEVNHISSLTVGCMSWGVWMPVWIIDVRHSESK